MTSSPLTEPMPVLRFLEGRGTDGFGRRVEEILSFDDGDLERNHDFIQWLFPLPERSQAQPQPPILTAEEIAAIRGNSVARANLDRVVSMMAGFYRRNDHWLRPHDHNHLRITRIIRSLALLHSREAAERLLSMIDARVEAAGKPVNSDSRGYSRQAVGALTSSIARAISSPLPPSERRSQFSAKRGSEKVTKS